MTSKVQSQNYGDDTDNDNDDDDDGGGGGGGVVVTVTSKVQYQNAAFSVACTRPSVSVLIAAVASSSSRIWWRL